MYGNQETQDSLIHTIVIAPRLILFSLICSIIDEGRKMDRYTVGGHSVVEQSETHGNPAIEVDEKSSYLTLRSS